MRTLCLYLYFCIIGTVYFVTVVYFYSVVLLLPTVTMQMSYCRTNKGFSYVLLS